MIPYLLFPDFSNIQRWSGENQEQGKKEVTLPCFRSPHKHPPIILPFTWQLDSKGQTECYTTIPTTHPSPSFKTYFSISLLKRKSLVWLVRKMNFFLCVISLLICTHLLPPTLLTFSSNSSNLQACRAIPHLHAFAGAV